MGKKDNNNQTNNKNTNSDSKQNNNNKKKKAGCLFRTCLSLMVFSLIILVGGIATGWYFGDKYLKENFNTSLKEAFRVVGDLKDYRSAKKEINQIEEGSSQDFIDSLNSAIFIKNGSLTVDEVKDILTDIIISNIDKDKKIESQEYLDKLNELFSEENLDKDKITGYDGEDYYISINGSDLTAFINDILIDNADKSDIINKIDVPSYVKDSIENTDIKDILSIKQIAFYKNENDQTGMTIITQTNFKKLIESGTKNIDVNQLDLPVDGFWMSLTNMGIRFSGWFVKSFILPKELYVSIDMPLSNQAPATVKLNNTDQKDWETVKKLASGLKTDAIDSFENMFLSDGGIGKHMTELNKNTPFSTMIENSDKGGVIKYDIIDLMIELSGINYYTEETIDDQGKTIIKSKKYNEEDCLTSKDILYSAKYLVGADAQAAMNSQSKIEKDYTRYTFKKDNDGNFIFENGLPVLDENGFDNLRQGALMEEELDNKRKEYEKLFIDALSKSYGLSPTTTFDNLFDMLSSDGNTDLNKVFDPQKIKEHLSGTSQEEGAIITDKMLCAIVAMRMQQFLGGQQSIDLETVIPRYLVLSQKTVEQTEHSLVDIGIEIKLQQMIESLDKDLGAFASIITMLVPDSFLVCVRMDISLGMQQDECLPTEISIEQLDYDNPFMTRILKVFDRLNVFGESMDSFMTQMLSPVKDVLGKMKETMPGLSLQESEIVLPDAMELIVSMLNQTMSTQIEREELEENMQFILNPPDILAYSVDDSLNDYLNWVYAMSNSTSITDLLDIFAKTEEEILDVFDTSRLIKMSDINSDYYSNKKTEFGLQDYSGVESYDAIINAQRLGQLILEFSQKDETIKDFVNRDSLKYVAFENQDDRDYIKIILQLDASVLMKDTDQSSTTQFFASVIDYIQMTVMIDISDGQKQNKVMINGDLQATDNLIEFIKKLGIDIEKTKDDIMAALDSSVVDALDKINGAGLVEFKLSQSGDTLVLTNVFDIMANITNTDKEPINHMNGTEIQTVVYHIYQPSIEEENGQTIFAKNNPILESDINLGDIIEERLGTPSAITTTAVTLADYELGRLMVEKTQEIGRLASFNIISKSDNGINAQRERDWLDGFDTGIDRDVDYISAIFEIQLLGENGFLGQANTSLAQKLLPQSVYGTVLLKQDASGYALEWFRLNQMDKDTQSLLYKLSGETEQSVQQTVDSYFNTSSNSLDAIIKYEMQEAVSKCSNAIFDVSMQENSSHFDAALPLPVGNTSVGSYTVTIEVSLKV